MFVIFFSLFQHLSPLTCCHSFQAGAIPILVDHLNHDMARVRIEATRALWSLAENNLETWEERDGLGTLLERKGGVVFFGWVGLLLVQICGGRSCFFCKARLFLLKTIEDRRLSR